MQYRTAGRLREKLSIIGIGGVPFQTMAEREIEEILAFGRAKGINLLDIFMGRQALRETLGKALCGHRQEWFIQGHLGTTEESGQTVRTRDLSATKHSFENLLKALNTDYIDVGMAFYVDSEEDYNNVFETEMLDYMLRLKKEGKIRYLGMGSHNPVTALKAVNTDLVDVLMFSMNPAYDLAKTEADIDTLKDHGGFGEEGFRVDVNRQTLYQTCEEKGIAVTVMKSLGAGTLLSEESSPFGKAMTVPQCLEYALSRPAVVAAVLGLGSIKEAEAALAYLDTVPQERQYAHIFEGTQSIVAEGRCMYCNHCQPCPTAIDIAAVTKFLDMARGKKQVSSTVKDHYHALEKTALDCVQCGDCEKNCPFGVDVRGNMAEALAIFGA